MEGQILKLIEEEVTRRVAVRISKSLEVISDLYKIPLDRLLKDTAHVEPAFCHGVNASGKRCLKEVVANGYCKFHMKQAPVIKVTPKQESPKPVIWQNTEPPTGLNI
jgi:hypothetical protein